MDVYVLHADVDSIAWDNNIIIAIQDRLFDQSVPVLLQDVLHFIARNFDSWLLWTECSGYALACTIMF